ncbi:MAG: TetR/AcrR family transcriptional regulator [Desulfobulbaceae bacterium]|nr:TetR/AcrR family transcriptional regulator [Desulfobulbaceae bacterium]
MISGRPLEYDPDAALDAAMQLFWEQGYEATSMSDLLQAMGLSKSSLYQRFSGKKELFLQCMARYTERVGTRLRGRLDQADSGREFIRELLLHAVIEAGGTECRRGCLLMNTASEFAQQDPEIASRVVSGFEGLRAILRQAVKWGQGEGEITSDQEADALAGYLMSTIAGLKTVVKGGASERQVREIVEIALRALR